jgi:hypothetical protein
MITNTDGESKLISCILPKGIAADVCEKLLNDKGIMTGNINNARGTGHITPRSQGTVGYESEKEIFSVVVDSIRADEIFEYIFDIADIDAPHGGIIYISALARSTEFKLPDIQEEA